MCAPLCSIGKDLKLSPSSMTYCKGGVTVISGEYIFFCSSFSAEEDKNRG